MGSLTHTCRLQGGFWFVYKLRVRTKTIKTQELSETQGMGAPLENLKKAKNLFPGKCTQAQSQKTFAYNFRKIQGPPE